jgi:hypothetical protein
MEIEMIEEVPRTELTVQDRAALALASSKTEADLRQLVVKNVSIVTVIDKAGREQAHGAAMELKRARTSIEKVSKDARDDATKFSKAVIAEEKRLIAIIEPEEARLVSLRDSWDAEQERIKEEAARIERERVLTITNRIGELSSMVVLATGCRTSEGASKFMERLNTSYKSFDFAEFQSEADETYNASYKRIQSIVDAKLTEEVAAAKVKADREAEAAALAAERAALAKEREAIAAERAAIEAAKPKADPVQEFEKQVQEFAAAVVPAVAPVVAPVVVPVAAPAKSKRPNNLAIISAVANEFKVDDQTALDWICAVAFGSDE